MTDTAGLTISFVDELPTSTTTGRTEGKYKPLAEALRANPGQFADVTDLLDAKPTGGVVTTINKGDLVDFRPEGHFLAAMRQVEGGAKRIFIKYVGEEGAKAYHEDKARRETAAAQAAAEAGVESVEGETAVETEAPKGRKGANAEA